MLSHMAWQGKEAAILGYGTIGQELSNWLLRNGANVTVYEPSANKLLHA